ncbi:MAG: recombinase family protein [Proteobacteria bacterium]|nr:recombinase family protein [Pseudomonadota bacterium]
MDHKKIVAYFRVSTRKQGESGLGLEGQEAAIATYAQGGKVKILASYTEVESGKLAERRELSKALAHARRSKATLVVAKLDRLARNVAVLSALMDSGVEFIACDNPYANRLTIHILAAVAEDEARRISERTKTALAAYKGLANEAYRDIEPLLRAFQAKGLSLRAMAREINSIGHTTRRGKSWNHVQIKRILDMVMVSKCP